MIPDARLVTLEGAGHSPHRTHNELFVATMVDFLRQMRLVLPEYDR
jgi:pimeloyl-ACP methyl ester carboxylesterase